MNKNRQRVLAGFRPARNGEQGLTLIEILIAMVILAMVAGVFLLGISTSATAVMVSQERVAVDSLAKSQMEFIKNQGYVNVADYNPNDPTLSYQLIAIPAD